MRRNLLSLLVVLLVACSNGNQRFSPKNKAIGTPNKLTIVCDKELWQTPAGDTLSKYLESVYPILPRPEPLYDVLTFTPYEMRIEPLRKGLRTYLLCASAQDTSSEAYKLVRSHLGERVDFTKVQLKKGKNRWAHDQVLMYYTAPTNAQLALSFSEYLPAISEMIYQHDIKKIKSRAFIMGVGERLSRKVDSIFNINIKLPADYVVASKQDSFIWLRRDFEDITANILIKEIKYTSKEQLTKSYMKELRNQLGKEHVESHTAGSYMVTNDVDLPMVLFNKSVDGHFVLQTKGIWEMNKDFMGGPFISYLMVRENRGTLLFVDAFVLAPGQKKRNMLQGIEYIIESMKLN